MEYCSGGGIIDLMNARMRNRLTEAEVLKIFGDVAAGLAVMHHMDPPLMHRDLKVENILLAPPPRSNPSAGPTYKLCDFGSSIPILSRRAPKSMEEVKKLEADLNMHTTLQYRAPEMVDVYQRRVIDEKADVWAMGVLLYKLCYYTTPFEENGGGPLAILNVRYRFPQSPVYSQRLKDLIASMLQEHSTSRPTIDQVMIGVHSILGTKPPASVAHYANLAASGKQVQPLPSVVSSSSASAFSGNRADIAARAMASKTASDGSGPAAGVNKDLIEIAPSESERRKVEQEELKKRSEGITPMRRGRPGRAPDQVGSSSSSAAAPVSSPLPSRPTSPSKASVPTQPSGPQLGFADSFSPPSLSAAHLAPSRPTSGMHYSPSMPGMVPSNRASPLPSVSLPPPITASKPSQQDTEEASTRFPSVEQLDLQYGSGAKSKPTSAIPRSRTLTIPTSLTASPHPSSSSRTTVIPGLAERKPVSAMAGSFANNANSSNGKATPPITSAPISGRWTGTGASASSVAKRWPHQDSTGASARLSPTLSKDSATPAPSLPARKPYLHDWLPESGQKQSAEVKGPSGQYTSSDPVSSSAEKIKEEPDSSDDEIEKPEDVNEHVAPASKRHSVMGKSLFEERRESIVNKPSPVVPSSSKVKTPDWLQQQFKAETGSSALETSAASISLGKQVLTQNENALQSVKATSPDTKSTAIAPAWDEDDEEMHFLPQPDLSDNHLYEQALAKQTTAATQTKTYADASTSPGRNTPVSFSAAADQQQQQRKQSSLSQQLAPEADEKKPPPVLSPKPVRSVSIRDVMSKYQDSKEGSSSPEVNTSPGVIRQRQESLVNGKAAKSTNAMGPPAITAPKPTASKKDGDTLNSRNSTYTKPSLKPWEKEAYEKEQVEKYGSLRSASPPKSTSGDKVGTHEAQERFSGVSSLISQWQTNSTKRAPGWGYVGGAGQDNQIESNIMARSRSREGEDDLVKRSSTINISNGRRPMQGRLPSREV
jgi:AP2-associated kinase